jgi:hypothetical protein
VKNLTVALIATLFAGAQAFAQSTPPKQGALGTSPPTSGTGQPLRVAQADQGAGAGEATGAATGAVSGPVVAAVAAAVVIGVAVAAGGDDGGTTGTSGTTGTTGTTAP